MKTLKEIIIDRKIRKGPADKITKDGAYWETVISIMAEGGDGIGQSTPTVTVYLELRHYRDGHLRGYINRHTWHQNDGSRNMRTRADDVLDVSTIEDLVWVIQGHKIAADKIGFEIDVYDIEVSPEGQERLATELKELPAREKSPDDDK